MPCELANSSFSGMTGQWDLTTWELDPRSVGDVAYQARRVFEWARQVLAKCGLTLEDIVSTTTFLRSMKDLEIVMRVTSEFIPKGDVTNTAVSGLDFVGAGELEINFVATFPDGR